MTSMVDKQRIVFCLALLVLLVAIFTYVFHKWLVLYIAVAILSFGGVGITAPKVENATFRSAFYTYEISLVLPFIFGYFFFEQG